MSGETKKGIVYYKPSGQHWPQSRFKNWQRISRCHRNLNFQHHTTDCLGEEREDITAPCLQRSDRSIIPLPAEYTNVPPVQAWKEELIILGTNTLAINGDSELFTSCMLVQYRWLEHINNVFDGVLTKDQDKTLMGNLPFKSKKKRINRSNWHICIPTIASRRGKICQYDTSLDGFDKAVNKLSKPWPNSCYYFWPASVCYWPETYEESRYVVMLSGLHTGMAALRTIGDWLEGSGNCTSWNCKVIPESIPCNMHKTHPSSDGL